MSFHAIGNASGGQNVQGAQGQGPSPGPPHQIRPDGSAGGGGQMGPLQMLARQVGQPGNQGGMMNNSGQQNMTVGPGGGPQQQFPNSMGGNGGGGPGGMMMVNQGGGMMNVNQGGPQGQMMAGSAGPGGPVIPGGMAVGPPRGPSNAPANDSAKCRVHENGESRRDLVRA